MGPRAGLDRCGKSRHPPGFDPRTVQSVASRYTDYTTRPPVSIIQCFMIRGHIPYHVPLSWRFKMDDGGISNSVGSAGALQAEGSVASVAPSWSVVLPCYVKRHRRTQIRCPLVPLSLFLEHFYMYIYYYRK